MGLIRLGSFYDSWRNIALSSASIKGATAFEVSVVRKVSTEFIGFDTILLSQGLLWTAFPKDYPEPFSLGQSQYWRI
ncbi:hypothetical protein F2Q69_00041814 [Brassica cretica]|uniref:Uncharacterized protein n=1 Tax=Brassica cretica TaxID=69181 RepID=A0A8S9NAG9_BRACR|nr:hypothetical protein F2Q69_00041814 [Brassica cretica]